MPSTKANGDEFSPQLTESTKLSRQVMNYLATKPKTIVEDKSDDMKAQLELKYDFLVNKRPVEFKADNYMHRTERISLEMYSNVQYQTPGWFLTSQAEIVLFMDTVNRIVHRIDNLEALREFVFQYNGDFSGRFTWTKVSKTASYAGQVIFLPHWLLKQHKEELQYSKFKVPSPELCQTITIPKSTEIIQDNSENVEWLRTNLTSIAKQAALTTKISA